MFVLYSKIYLMVKSKMMKGLGLNKVILQLTSLKRQQKRMDQKYVDSVLCIQTSLKLTSITNSLMKSQTKMLIIQVKIVFQLSLFVDKTPLLNVKELLDTLTQKQLEKQVKRVLELSLGKAKILIVLLKCLLPKRKIYQNSFFGLEVASSKTLPSSPSILTILQLPLRWINNICLLAHQ